MIMDFCFGLRPLLQAYISAFSSRDRFTYF